MRIQILDFINMGYCFWVVTKRPEDLDPILCRMSGPCSNEIVKHEWMFQEGRGREKAELIIRSI